MRAAGHSRARLSGLAVDATQAIGDQREAQNGRGRRSGRGTPLMLPSAHVFDQRSASLTQKDCVSGEGNASRRPSGAEPVGGSAGRNSPAPHEAEKQAADSVTPARLKREALRSTDVLGPIRRHLKSMLRQQWRSSALPPSVSSEHDRFCLCLWIGQSLTKGLHGSAPAGARLTIGEE